MTNIINKNEQQKPVMQVPELIVTQNYEEFVVSDEKELNVTHNVTDKEVEDGNDEKDVGETLRKIMEAETRKLEDEWETQQKAKELLLELELQEKSKLSEFDVNKEFLFDSPFHRFLMKQIKNEFITTISSKYVNFFNLKNKT